MSKLQLVESVTDEEIEYCDSLSRSIEAVLNGEHGTMFREGYDAMFQSLGYGGCAVLVKYESAAGQIGEKIMNQILSLIPEENKEAAKKLSMEFWDNSFHRERSTAFQYLAIARIMQNPSYYEQLEALSRK